MNISEIEKKIKEILYLIELTKKDICNLQKDYKKLLEDRRVARFELVIENIEIGQVIIELKTGIGELSAGDTIKIIRKNKKSVTVEILDNKYSWNKKRIGLLKRIPCINFGDVVFTCKEIQTSIIRNEKLEMLLQV